MISEEQLQEWERLAKEATEGPWYAYEGRDYSEIHERTATHARALALVGSKHKDAMFIAAARDAVPALIAEVRELQAENDKYYNIMVAINNKNAQFIREAEWIAENVDACPPGFEYDISCLKDEGKSCVDCWREAARKAVEND